MDAPPAGEGWLLYDASCGFCSRWVPFWSGMLRRRGYGVVPLQSAWVAERLHLEAGEITADLRLLLRDEKQIRGADVYRHLMKRIWWAYPLYLCSVTPILRGVFDAAYRGFADHRHRISRMCRLGVPRRP